MNYAVGLNWWRESMAVVIETTLGDITVDLFTEERPRTCLNFLKLCKIKYYNFCLFHSVQHNFLAQTGDPTGLGKNGESVFGKIRGEGARFYEAEVIPKLKHTKPGLLSMVNCGNNMLGSQFFITLGSELQSLDNEHCVFGKVAEGNEVLLKLNEVICDSEHRPYQDIRITHTVILDDPFDDPPGLQIPDYSPEPSAEALMNGRIAPDEQLDETQGLSAAEIEERERSREARAQATILEIVGDLPDADMAPPENVLFVCKLNPVTSDDDLEIIFSRFGKVKSCEVIRDKLTGDSLQYAFVEFEDRKACEDAYFKMDNVLIDDRRIHVDFSQSVARLRWKGRGRGVEHVVEKAETKQDRSGRKYDRSQCDYTSSMDRVESQEVENRQHNHGNDRSSRGNEFDRDKNNAYKRGRRLDDGYKCGSRQEGERDKRAARNDKDSAVESRHGNENEKRSRQSYERSGEVDRIKCEEDPRGVNKDARSSHSNDESKRFRDGGKDVKVKQEARNKHFSEEGKKCRDKNKDIQHVHSNGEGKTHKDIDKGKCEESQNRHISEKDKRCRVTNKDVRSEEERIKNIDKNITVKHNSEKDKRLAKQMEEGIKKCKDTKEKHRETVKGKSDRKARGESMTKETKKRRHSSSLVQSRKKHKRSTSSDSESSSSSNFTSSTDSSSSESSDEQSKARHKKHHKKPSVLARKSKKKLKLAKKSTRKRKKDSNTDSSSFGSSDSSSRGRSRNKRKRRRKGVSSEEDSSSEHEVKQKKKKKKRKKKPKVTMKRKRKSSSSEDSETDDTSDTSSSDSEDQKPSRKRHKKVIKKRKKNHTTSKKSVQRSKSDESRCGDKKVRSSTSD